MAEKTLIQDDKEVARELFTMIKHDTTAIETGLDGSISGVGTDRGQKLLVAEHFSDMGLSDELLKAIYNQGFEKPSLIQKSAIPHILRGHNVVVQSKSGTGKTIAYTCGVLGNTKIGERTQVMVVTPTRELSTQVTEVISGLAGPLGIKVFSALKNKITDSIGEEVVVGSPGTILKLMELGKLNYKGVKMIVLDEADILLDKDMMGTQTFRILKLISGAQMIFFSATFSEQVKQTIEFYAPDAVKMYEERNGKPDEIKLFYIEAEGENKRRALKSLYEYLSISQMIIFVSTKATVNYLRKKLEDDLHSVSCLHGDLEIEEREKAVGDFRSSKSKILLTTDVFSRGMDIPQVNLIVNYDLPIYRGVASTQTYIHRIGRSGRFGRTGFVVDFVRDEELEAYLSFQKELKFASKKFTIRALEEVAEELG
ncbi:ATP-DEPENDENT RNA HELICASE INVOLVED IN mRNA EXPORT FROM THE NUCLEUS [Encephalitozoon cuniculi GB-M1]|uniref:RNA helicase n=2 Tax=Encephalitozoon cuniculi TaxID=6035 RepID=Q8SSD2_ENCCU|nr:putative DEAD-box helicase [Encephalitozoon cuniculi GB-M1]AGE95551.1 ATP-dependent RNA helicase involved in mRNA export from the nucleus [Encephalitozoon cuniculi]KMV66670.1 putative DEAD-box helicase [Encephalitozoon cuniculi EcunIII-L]UYI28347.1 DEAD box RNA helicase [Encephalitozoon cuniculi]CAD25181.1 ATP-DEPENDENT RNA HELICASE INVOLVED IN mRNA EXPORT FROM THE NUCLEUS [Encephalitozoon cuniculi GB-M1]